MKKSLVLLLFLPNFLWAQESKKDSSLIANNAFRDQSRANAVNNMMNQNTSSQMLYYKAAEINVKGSPYFHDEFVAGEVWFKDGSHIQKDVLFKFDEVQNAIIVKKKDGVELILESITVLGCRMMIGDKPILYFRGDVPNVLNEKKIFQLVYNSDKYRVIKLPNKRLVPKHKTFHNDVETNEYQIKHQFFVKKGEGDFEEFELNRRSIIDVFPEKEATLNVLFKKPEFKGRLTEQKLAELLMILEEKK